MSGYNRFTYGVEFNRLAIPGGVESTLSSAFASDSQVTNHLTEIFRELQLDLGYKIDVARLNLTGEDPLYTLPVNRIGQNITQINVLLPNGRIGPPVDRVTEQQLLNWGWDTNESNNVGGWNGGPYLWAPSNSDPTKFWLRPTPQYTAPSGVVISYNPQLAPLNRVYNQTTVTANVTNGSASVPLSALVSGVRIRAGDEFGVKGGTNFDGTTTLNQTPTIWYVIDSIAQGAVTTLTLQSPYDEDTNATAGFITSCVSPLEAHVLPQSLGYAPVIGALAIEFKRSRKALSADFRAEFLDAKRNYIPDSDGSCGTQYGAASFIANAGGIRWY